MLYEERYFIRELNGHPGLIRVAISLSAPEDTTRATLDSTRIVSLRRETRVDAGELGRHSGFAIILLKL